MTSIHRARTSLLPVAIVCAAIASIASCTRKPGNDPYAPLSEADRDTQRAIALNGEAVPLLNAPDAASLRRAEDLLRSALAADLYFGPAHNNLGILYLGQGKYFEAAGEFEWARRLLPGHPDPRVNLAMTLDAAGRADDAVSTYKTALEVYPDSIAAMQGLARLQIKRGRPDEKTPVLLREIAMRGESAEWREWAKGELTRVR